MAIASTQLLTEPGLGKLPVAPYGFNRNVKRAGSFFFSEAAKEHQLHNLGLPRVHQAEPVKGLVYQDKVRRGAGVRFRGGGIDCYVNLAATAFIRLVRASKIDEDPPHQPCAESEEMGPIPEIQLTHVHQLQIDLMDEGGGLKSVPTAFIDHVAVGSPVQLVVHQVHQLAQCLLVPHLPCLKQKSNVVC